MLTRRLLLNLALLLVIAGLVTFVMWPRSKPAPTGQILAPDVDASAVRHIRIERRGRPPLEFTRTDDGWRLNAPIHADANPLLMQALLALPDARSEKRYPVAGLDLAQYGLAPPRVTVSFDHARIELGTLNALNQLRYARRGDGLYLIPDGLSALPESPALAWVSLALLPPAAHIASLQLPALDIRAKHPAGWTLSPAPPHYSADQVAALLDTWRKATALRLTPATASPATSQGDIRITLSDGTRLHFQIIATQPTLILRDPALQADYHLPGALADRLLHLSAVTPTASS